MHVAGFRSDHRSRAGLRIQDGQFAEQLTRAAYREQGPFPVRPRQRHEGRPRSQQDHMGTGIPLPKEDAAGRAHPHGGEGTQLRPQTLADHCHVRLIHIPPNVGTNP